MAGIGLVLFLFGLGLCWVVPPYPLTVLMGIIITFVGIPLTSFGVVNYLDDKLSKLF